MATEEIGQFKVGGDELSAYWSSAVPGHPDRIQFFNGSREVGMIPATAAELNDADKIGERVSAWLERYKARAEAAAAKAAEGVAEPAAIKAGRSAIAAAIKGGNRPATDTEETK